MGFLDKLDKDIRDVMLTAGTILSKFRGKDKSEYWITLYALRNEVMFLNEIRNYIVDGFSEYLGCKLVIWLVTDADLTNIRKNIENLVENQCDIMHVVHESISILNMSRIEIAENRQAVADLLVSVTALDKKLLNLIDDVRKQIQETKHFLAMYLKLNLITMEIKDDSECYALSGTPQNTTELSLIRTINSWYLISIQFAQVTFGDKKSSPHFSGTI